MGVDPNFTDVESQITSLYQYFNFPVLAAIEPHYVNIMKYFWKVVQLFPLVPFTTELLDHENMGMDIIFNMLADLVLKICTFFSSRLMAVTN